MKARKGRESAHSELKVTRKKWWNTPGSFGGFNVLWIGLFLLSSGWLFHLPIYVEPTSFWVPCVIVGIVVNSLFFRGMKISPFDWRYYLLGIPILLFIVAIPAPYNLGAMLLLCALAIALVIKFVPKSSWLVTPICLGISFSGIVLLVQNVAIHLHYVLAPRFHRADFLTPLFHWGLRLVGIDSYLVQGVVRVPRVIELYSIATTWEKLGILLLLPTLLGGLVLLLLSRNWRRNLLFLLSSLTLFTLLRYIFLVLVVISVGHLSPFWSASVTMATFFPLFVILGRWSPVKLLPFNLSPPAVTRRHAIVLCLTSLAVMLLTSSIVYQDPGTRKAGRLLIDELHSDWEWTEQSFDTKWFGRKSGYNYYCLAEYLNYYYHVSRSHELITPDLLGDYDILLVKTPTESLSPEEISAIEEFVKAGGGLYLHGDHTNVFGSSGFLNQITARFGLTFRYDSTYDLLTSALNRFYAPHLLPHPIVNFMPPFLFATSCSMGGSLLSEGVMVGNMLRAAPLDYSQRSFFPAKTRDFKDYEFGLFFQAVARKYGRGRVLGFTDSTVFSNFFMFIPGKPELALASIEWLNRANRYSSLKWLMLVISIVIGYLSLKIGRKLSPADLLIFLMGGCLAGSSIGLRSMDFLHRRFYPPPPAHTDYTHIAFEREHTNYFLPELRLGGGNDRSFHTFFVWTQRLGYIPKSHPRLKDALREGDALVMIEPQTPFSIQEVDEIADYIEGGGRLLLLDDPVNRKSSANQLLTIFGMEISSLPPQTIPIYNDSLRVMATARNPGQVSRGDPILWLGNRSTVLAEKAWGEGKILVFTNSSLFTNQTMGHTGVTPNAEQIKISELEFFILRRLMEERKISPEG